MSKPTNRELREQLSRVISAAKEFASTEALLDYSPNYEKDAAHVYDVLEAELRRRRATLHEMFNELTR